MAVDSSSEKLGTRKATNFFSASSGAVKCSPKNYASLKRGVWGLAEPRENPLLLILLRVSDDKIRYTVSHSIKQVSYRYHKVKF